jgi:CubicO group peptidase (beta-lactamase class C family)
MRVKRRIVALCVLGLASCSSHANTPTRSSESEVMKALRVEIENVVAAGRFSGTVLVARDGVPVFTQAYGLADRERKISNKLDTRFRIGSMNKMFTAVAVMQLVQAGKLDLGEPLGKYMPDYPNKEVSATVTIHQLLTHTGGTGDIFVPEYDARRREIRTLKDYVALLGDRGLEWEPGSRFEYSNYGFILLGAVIEKVTGQSYYDYVREHVYAPAGMASTGSEPEDHAVPNRSVGYTTFDFNRPLQSNAEWLPYRGTSAGGGYSTVADLLKFANALQQHKLLDAHNTELLTIGKVDEPLPGARYAYGFRDRQLRGTRCFGHGGGAPGMNGELRICPAAGYVVAVLSNLDPPAADEISDLVTDRLLKR